MSQLTLNKISAVKVFLNNTYNTGDVFKYTEIEKFLTKSNIHVMVFYYFVYAKTITKISKGTYKLNSNFYNTSIKIIHRRGAEHLAWLREKRKEHVSNFPKQQSTLIASEDYCIKYLKSLGYKILKPINQFEEI